VRVCVCVPGVDVRECLCIFGCMCVYVRAILCECACVCECECLGALESKTKGKASIGLHRVQEKAQAS